MNPVPSWLKSANDAWVTAKSTESLVDFIARSQYDNLYTAAAKQELDKRNYIEEVTRGIPTELGFTELLNVL